MSLYRRGQLSTYSPETSTIDSFAIKKNYTSLEIDSLESSDHFNHYFDACIQIEKQLPKFLGTNIKAFYPLTSDEINSSVFKQVEGNQILLTTQVTSGTMVGNGQEFSVTIPDIFGSNPFRDNSFSLSVRADEFNYGAEGVFANKNPNSSDVWNTLSNQNHFVCSVQPSSGLGGRTFTVKVSAVGRTPLPGSQVSFSERFSEATLSSSTLPIVGGKDFSLTPTSTGIFPRRLSSSRYTIDYYGVSGGFVYPNNPDQTPFAVAVKNIPLGGFSLLSTPDDRVLALTSNTTAARYETTMGGYLYGIAARSGILYGVEGLDRPDDQFVQFRLCGFAADSPFFGRNFGCFGPAVRMNGPANNASFYGLVFGEAAGTLTTSTSGLPADETAPRIAYLAKFKNVNLSQVLDETVTLKGSGTAPYVSTTVSGATILTGTSTLVFSASDMSVSYRLAASGNTIILQQEAASGLFTNLLTYTDTNTVSNGYPGFFSVGKSVPQTASTKSNRWLLFDSLKMGDLATGATIPIQIRSFFSKTGMASSYNIFSSFTTNETIIDDNTTPTASGVVLRWNDTQNHVYRGCDVNPSLPWFLGLGGSSRAIPEPGSLLLQLTSYQFNAWNIPIVPISVLLVAPSGYNIANGNYVAKFRITTGDASGFYTNINGQDLRTKFEFGISDSPTAVVRSSSYESNKIQYINVPLSQMTFSSQTLGSPQVVDFVIPMNQFNITPRFNACTFYIKGEMLLRGTQNIHISDIVIGEP